MDEAHKPTAVIVIVSAPPNEKVQADKLLLVSKRFASKFSFAKTLNGDKVQHLRLNSLSTH
jgi:hypothetical protein